MVRIVIEIRPLPSNSQKTAWDSRKNHRFYPKALEQGVQKRRFSTKYFAQFLDPGATDKISIRSAVTLRVALPNPKFTLRNILLCKIALARTDRTANRTAPSVLSFT